jgi:hypothetical protein
MAEAVLDYVGESGLEELIEKYGTAGTAEREAGLRGPYWGGERQGRYMDACNKAGTILEIFGQHEKFKELSGRSVLTPEQEASVLAWGHSNTLVLALAGHTQETINQGTMWQFTEAQVADLEACAEAGLEIFEPAPAESQ